MQRKAIYTTGKEASLIQSGSEWNFHDAYTQEHLHSLHPYPAKFIPQIPRKAITKWTKKGELVYDPFAGCGTTLLEASLLGRPSIGTDNNPVAVLVSAAKTARYTASQLKALKSFLAKLDEFSIEKQHRHLIPDNENFLYWFNKEILDALASLKAAILKSPKPIQGMLLAVFSSIIVRVSFQDSDTRYAKIKREVKPSDVQRHFKARLIEAISSLQEIMLPSRAKAVIRQADARKIPFIKSNSVSLIVTSPPYLNAYDYHKYHRQRIHWISGSVEFARDIEIGSHDQFTRPRAKPDQFFRDMDQCFAEWSRVLKPGGRCLIVIGDSIVSKTPVPVGDTFIDLFIKRGVTLEKRWIRTLHATKRAFNVRNSRISHEHVLLFKKKRISSRKPPVQNISDTRGGMREIHTS